MRRQGHSLWLQRNAARLGLDIGHLADYRRSAVPVLRAELPFSGATTLKIKGYLGASIAMQWFLSHGYMVSIPVEPAAYDLVVESDDGLKRVQVKTTQRLSASGAYCVKITRSVYAPGAKLSSRGRYLTLPYEPGMVDFFFITAADGRLYLIPFDAVLGVMDLSLTNKYAAYEVTQAHPAQSSAA
jgi:hypothetical protein